jgi:ABC-type Fe3+ transport system permease subunit
VYAVNKLDVKFSSVRNRTIVGLVFEDNQQSVEMITFLINNFILPFAAFVVIFICTTILLFRLRVHARWRQTSTIDSKIIRATNRNHKAAKMATIVSSLFIVCFVPVNVIVLCIAFLPSMSFNGKHMGVSIILGGMGYTMESINSSMNIFIYYYMSSKYKLSFCRLFLQVKIVKK